MSKGAIMEKCNRCKYFKKDKKNPERGNCHVYPPVVVADKSSNSGRGISVYPQTQRNSHCSLFVDKNPSRD